MDASFEPQLVERAGIVRPALAYLHPEREVKAAAEQVIELEAGGPPDPFQSFPLGTDNDRLVPGPVDPDRRVHVELSLLLLHTLDLDGDTVRQLLLQLECQLL